MLIIPGATAYLLTDRFSRMLIIAPIVSMLCGLVGLYISYYRDTPRPAAWLSWCGGSLPPLVYLFSPSHGIVAGWIRRRRQPRPVGGSPVAAELSR